jgi:hypothetical protein
MASDSWRDADAAEVPGLSVRDGLGDASLLLHKRKEDINARANTQEKKRANEERTCPTKRMTGLTLDNATEEAAR